MSSEDWTRVERSVSDRIANPGVSPVEEMRKRSGLQFLQDIVSGKLPFPPIGKALNFFPVEAEEGRVLFQGTPKFDFYNPIGSIHGGWACTLLDSCMSCAVQTTIQAGFAYTTGELKVNMVRPITEKTGPVRAEGKVIHPGRQLATAEGRIFGADGKLYAHGTTTCLIFPIPESVGP